MLVQVLSVDGELCVAGLTTVENDTFCFASEAIRAHCVTHIPAASRGALCRAAASVADLERAAFLLIEAGDTGAGIAALESLEWGTAETAVAKLWPVSSVLSPRLAETLSRSLIACGRYRDAAAVAPQELLLAHVDRRSGDYETALMRLDRIAEKTFDAGILRRHGVKPRAPWLDLAELVYSARGVVYGATDGLLLSVFPILAVFAARLAATEYGSALRLMRAKLAFWRPLSSALLSVDHALFGRLALAYHAHSLLWFGALLLVVAGLLVRIVRIVLSLILRSWERSNAFTALAGVVIWLLALGIATAVLVGDIRALVGSLGLVGLALSWALQTPIESFTGWLLNSFHGYYRVGDRVAVGDVFGDVYRIDFLTTTVWEYGSPSTSPGGIRAEQPTGRLITFPNHEILTGAVVNYTRDFPYVWDELVVAVAPESDLESAEYRERCLTLAVSPQRLRDLRRDLRSRMQASELMDPTTLARSIEGVLLDELARR